MGKMLDITGERYGRLVAVRNTGRRQLRNFIWCFQCDCGVMVERPAGEVRRGKIQSCGCIKKEEAAKRFRKIAHLGSAATKTHGMTGSPEFNAWTNMIQRCTNSKHKSFNRYGGRGIKVCDRWLNSFDAFFEDMGKKPTYRHQLDRIENDGDYDPSNCHWTLPLQNANNRSSSRKISHDGLTLSLAEWARRNGMSRQALRYRIENGWDFNDAITRPMSRCSGKIGG